MKSIIPYILIIIAQVFNIIALILSGNESGITYFIIASSAVILIVSAFMIFKSKKKNNQNV